MKKTSLILGMFFLSCMLFAGVSQTAGLGTGWDSYFVSFQDGSDMLYKADLFDITLSGMTVLDQTEHLVIYENVNLGYTKAVSADGLITDVDCAFLVGLNLGVGYSSEIKKTPLSYSVGAGLGWNRFSAKKEDITIAFSEFTANLFGNLRYDVKDGWFVDLTVLDSASFYTNVWNKYGVVSRSSNYLAFFNNLAVTVGFGYRFDFR